MINKHKIQVYINNNYFQLQDYIKQQSISYYSEDDNLKPKLRFRTGIKLLWRKRIEQVAQDFWRVGLTEHPAPAVAGRR